MGSPRLVRRLALTLAALAALVAGAAPARTDRPAEDLGEVWTSPVLRRAWRTRFDPVTGAKWLETDDGERAESVAAVVAAEESALSDLERRVDPALLARMRDAGEADVPVVVIFRMVRQPASEAADAASLRHDPALERLAAEMRAILGRLADRRAAGEPVDPREEETLLAPGERDELRRLRAALRETVRTKRREVLDAAKPAAFVDQEALVADLGRTGGAKVLARPFVLSCVAARVPVGAIERLLADHPEVAHVAPSRTYRTTLDNSVPVVGASSWWSAGITGTSSTKIAILDTGVDSSHPALSSNVSDEAVYLSTAYSDDSDFADDTSSTDDFYGHGTHVAGISASSDSTYGGVAPGAALMNAKCGYLWQDKWGNSGGALQDPDIMDAGDWAADTGADVFNCSFGGGGTTDGSSDLTLFFDAIVQDLGIDVAVSAGNSGSGSGTIGVPADGFNVFAVGNWDDQDTSSLSDDSIASSSSRGPLDDGRRKPDLAAPGTNITSCDAAWETTGTPDFVGMTGTSMASPHVAGALALLRDYGAAAYPEGMKALLLTNTRNSSPFPSSPGNTWGYGAMDLSATYTNRASLYEGSLSSSGARFVLLDGSSFGSAKRITLAWGRRVISKGNAVPTSYSSPLDLDLYVYDESDGTSRGSSRSSLDSVEQVSTSASVGGLVVKVYRAASSFPSGLSTQRFAVATESKSSLATATGPSLVSSFTALPSQIAGTTDFTVSVSVQNAGDLTAIAPSLTLTIPSGYSVVSGSNPVTLSNLAAGSTASGSWTVRSPSTGSGSKTFSAAATTSSYGETFAGAAKTGSQTLDVDAPANPSVTLAAGATYATSSTMTATLSATDTGTGVSSMRLRTAGDAWGSWVNYATSATVTLSGGDGARTFQAEFRDGVGNVSSTASDGITVDTVAPTVGVSVAGGAAWTTSAAVTLTTTASDSTSGVADMRFSNDGSSWSSWSQFGTSAGWTLTGSDGAKTVYAQVRDKAGNVSASASDDAGLDRAAPSGTVTIDAGNAWAASANVTLGLSASDATSGVASMRFSDDGATWSAWTTFASTAAWTLPGADGTKTVHAQFRDAAGNVSSTVTDSIGLDSTLPSGTVAIAGGAVWTGTRDVTLATSVIDGGSSVSEMRFSDDGSTWSSWTTLAASASWTLPAGEGTKTVHAQFRDAAGNLSPTVTDSIGLDQSAPTGAAVTVAAGAAWTTTADVTLALAATDGLSGVSSMRFSDDGATWSAWTTFAATAAWTLSGADGTKTVHAQFRDAVGNVSATVTDGVGLDRAVPTGTVTAAGGSPWTAGPDVELGVSVGGDTSGVASMRFSDDGASWSAWTAFAASSPWTLPGADGAKSVYAQFRDVAGNVSATVSDGIGLDRGAPSATLLVAGGAAWVPSAEVTLSPTGGDATSGVLEMRFSDDGTKWSSWSAISDSAPWTLPAGDGPKVVHLQVRDAAGNVSGVATDGVGLDTEAPAGSVVLENGAAATNRSPIALSLAWTDATAGVRDMRFSDDGEVWSAWSPVAATATRTLPAGDGVRAVRVQFRDAAGNVSADAADDVLVDTVAPAGTIVLGGGVDYLAPGTTLAASLAASDTPGGSGVAEFRWREDSEISWSGWIAFDAIVDLGPPEGDRDVRRTVLGQFRDVAGNISAATQASIHLVSATPQDADQAKTIRGRLGAGGDVDAYRVRLAQGDRLDARVALHAPKGTKLTVGLDLCDESGARLVAGRWPERGPAGRIRGFRAPASGTYVLVVHSLTGDVAAEVPYDLTTATRIGRAAVRGSGAGVGEVAFDAAEGRVLTGSLRGLSLGAAVLEGPDGDPAGLTLRGGTGGRYTLPPQTLAFGSGRYVLRVAPAASGKVRWALRLALPHRARTAAETIAP